MELKKDYEPFTNFLKSEFTDQSRIRLHFNEIEEKLGFSLPPESKMSRSWWKNDRNRDDLHSNSWLDAGLIVIAVKFNENGVEFLRIK